MEFRYDHVVIVFLVEAISENAPPWTRAVRADVIDVAGRTAGSQGRFSIFGLIRFIEGLKETR